LGLGITQERQRDRKDKFEKCLVYYELSETYFGHTPLFSRGGVKSKTGCNVAVKRDIFITWGTRAQSFSVVASLTKSVRSPDNRQGEGLRMLC